MGRTVVCGLVTLVLFVGTSVGADKPAKNQMVKGTIKSVDAATKVLVVNQKVGNEFVDRELNITDNTAFVITKGDEQQQAVGKDGLRLLEGQEGASITVKCDKDVNVLKVTVKLKK